MLTSCMQQVADGDYERELWSDRSSQPASPAASTTSLHIKQRSHDDGKRRRRAQQTSPGRYRHLARWLDHNLNAMVLTS